MPTPTPTPTPAATPSVSIAVAPDGTDFLVTRTGDTSGELVVHYTVKGSAVAGTDYAALAGTRKMKAGKASVPIKVKPTADGQGTVKLRLVDGQRVHRGRAHAGQAAAGDSRRRISSCPLDAMEAAAPTDDLARQIGLGHLRALCLAADTAPPPRPRRSVPCLPSPR